MMVLGRIVGRSTTTHFEFQTEGSAKKFQFIQVYHQEHDYVLCQVYEIERDVNQTIAKCQVIGFRDEQGRIRGIRTPFEPNAEVLLATDDLIRSVVQLDDSAKGAMVGKIDGRSIQIYLNINKMLTKHIAVLAKSGSGKSYSVGVLLEELLSHKIPIVIIDPHGEYSSLKWPNDNMDDVSRLAEYGMDPKGFVEQIVEYGDMKVSPDLKPITLPQKLTADEILHMLPTKLSSAQQALFFTASKDFNRITIEELAMIIAQQEHPAKHTLLSVLNYLRKLGIFGQNALMPEDIIQPGKASVFSLKGMDPEVQEIVAYKVLKDLFEARKLGKIPPFFAVIEEAHNFAPERGFGDTKSSKIIRTIAAEGRKFGMGLCVITQRPARVEKNVLSQCSTQIILKVTNPGDLKAISTSVEGINSESEQEIRNLPIGVAMITGVVDIPLFVSIRPRMTLHGGTTVNIIDEDGDEAIDAQGAIDEFSQKEMMPLITPNITETDLLIMSDEDTAKIEKVIVPAVQVTCEDKDHEFMLLVDATDGGVIVDLEKYRTKLVPQLDKLTPSELGILEMLFKQGVLHDAEHTQLINQGKGGLIERLKGLGLITVDRGITLSSKYIFSKLSKYQNYSKIEYKELQYDNKLDRAVPIEQVAGILSRFTAVKDTKECYVLKYVLEKAQGSTLVTE